MAHCKGWLHQSLGSIGVPLAISATQGRCWPDCGNRVLLRRMLKYTPEHMHCLANIYCAHAPPNTGVLAVRSTAANQKVRRQRASPARPALDRPQLHTLVCARTPHAET